MKVNGHQLAEALRRWRARRTAVVGYFQESMYQFEEDLADADAISSRELAAQCENAEAVIARLEAAQQRYNAMIEIADPTDPRPLAVAIKEVGAAMRMEALWRNLIPQNNSRYHYGLLNRAVREADSVVATRQISVRDTFENAERWMKRVSTLKAMIAEANGQSRDLREVEREMLE